MALAEILARARDLLQPGRALEKLRFDARDFEVTVVQAELRLLHQTDAPPDRAALFADCIGRLATPDAVAALSKQLGDISITGDDARAAQLLATLLGSGGDARGNAALRLIFNQQYEESLKKREGGS